MPTLNNIRLILLFISTTALPACSWVDSTGNQGTEVDAGSGVDIPDITFESGLVFLHDGDAVALLENSTGSAQLLNDNSHNGIWSWELGAEGENARCNGINGFDSSVAGDTLQDSCTDPDSCEIQISPASEQATYTIELPKLAAPVALRYLLHSELADGTPIEREQTVCALAVNEAPTATNDNYRAIAGELLEVAGTDADSLLANDTDDIDVQNQTLRVDGIVVSAPQYASVFRLLSNGGFIYRSISQLPFDASGTLIDSFDYRIGDGQHDATATATIRITAANEAPISLGRPPDVSIELTDDETPTYLALDVSPYFDSVDNDTLIYFVDSQSLEALPEGLMVRISDNGILEISIDVTQQASVVGTWPLEIIASDNLATASSTLFVIVELTPRTTNQAPVAEDISNRTVEDDFEYDISGFFSDPDGDTLSFSSQRLPQDVSLSPDGVLSGSGSRRNEGAWFILIKAEDGFGGSVSDGFLLTIR